MLNIHPITGRLVITTDREVKERALNHGFAVEPFEQMRTLLEVEQRFHAIEEGEREAAEAIMAEAAEAEPEPMPEQAVMIPAALPEGFRAAVIGDGKMTTWAGKLKHAVEREIYVCDVRFSPMREWSKKECKRAWSEATQKQHEAWGQCVTEMLQVYCILMRHERGDALPLHDNLMAAGNATFTQVRAVARESAKGLSGRQDYHVLCNELCTEMATVEMS